MKFFLISVESLGATRSLVKLLKNEQGQHLSIEWLPLADLNFSVASSLASCTHSCSKGHLMLMERNPSYTPLAAPSTWNSMPNGKQLKVLKSTQWILDALIGLS
jgi:hypothetical protein